MLTGPELRARASYGLAVLLGVRRLQRRAARRRARRLDELADQLDELGKTGRVQMLRAQADRNREHWGEEPRSPAESC
ncbi:Hypothetical protein AJAP_42905 (plasmid) [Amycolatopsis japonica]|uniref:Uncharacterized protein n=1 Tax=Amycolatopsis japonica TaxID=208439 RepID=A0A075V784_9PSEU|nr:hypothetical protein [Amycolatopsis japonica]AIG81348.1 Hypothetical protein AJAP_42905 [Amycolatopsis japonica]